MITKLLKLIPDLCSPKYTQCLGSPVDSFPRYEEVSSPQKPPKAILQANHWGKIISEVTASQSAHSGDAEPNFLPP